jgi:hypothetical protein
MHPVQQLPLVHLPAGQTVMSDLFGVAQFPLELQTGFLHGLEVVQVSQFSPLSPQLVVVFPV